MAGTMTRYVPRHRTSACKSRSAFLASCTITIFCFPRPFSKRPACVCGGLEHVPDISFCRCPALFCSTHPNQQGAGSDLESDTSLQSALQSLLLGLYQQGLPWRAELRTSLHSHGLSASVRCTRPDSVGRRTFATPGYL